MKAMLLALLAMMLWEIRSQNQLGLPDPAMAEQLLSSIPKISKVIRDQLEDKPDTVRNMISSVFGNGLLSQLVDPSQMANQLALNLDNQLLKPKSVSTSDLSNTEQKPRSKTSQLFLGAESDPNEPKEQLFVDGRPVKDESKILKIYDMNRDPNQPERTQLEGAFVDSSNPQGGSYALKYTEKRIQGLPTTRRPLQTSTASQLTSSTPNAFIEADTILKTLRQFFGVNSSAKTTETSVAVAESEKPMTQQVWKDSPPADTSERSQQNDEDNALKTSETFVDQILNSMKTQGSKTLLPEEVKALQQYLVLQEQNQQTRELLNKRQRLRQIQVQLEEHKMKINEQRFREKQLRMQEAQLQEEKLNVENQLQQQYNMWHRAFDVQPLLSSSSISIETPLLERLSYTKSSLPHEHDLDYFPGDHYRGTPNIYYDYTTDLTDSYAAAPSLSSDAHSVVANDPVEEETQRSAAWPELEPDITKNPTFEYAQTSTSRLPPHPEPSTVVRYSPFKASSYNRTFYGRFNPSSLKETSLSGRCDCIEVDLSRLKGHWAQPLSSISLQRTFQNGIAKLFDSSTDSVELECSNIEFLEAEQTDQVQQVGFEWAFKTLHSERYFRLNGKIVVADGRIAHVVFNDFTDRTYQFPICVLKAGEQEVNDYEYLVVVNADGPCRSAAVLARNPGTFFEEPSRELIYFLRHRVATDELEPMDVHLKPCPT